MPAVATASSHREAPMIAGMPRVDGSDFYMFKSYEAGRGGFVTLIANYLPLQDGYGGPNYFKLDPAALYEIHVDNNGDSAEDLTFQFRFTNTYKGLGVPTGASGGNLAVPLDNIGTIDAAGANLNVTESYTLSLIRGNRRTGTRSAITGDDGATFQKPADNIGIKSIPDYAAYAQQFIYDITIPGCATKGRVFVGQRQDGFVVNLGQVFDLVNLNPLGARDSGHNAIAGKNVTSLALEVPTSCLTAGNDPVIGGWTTASLPQSRVLNPNPQGPVTNGSAKGPAVEGGAYTQVSRLGSPLVNEVVIGITDKDKFNASEPKDDVANFGAYVLYPTLPVLVNALFSVPPPATPRNDLLAAFVTGITATVNGQPFKFTAPANLTVPGEMLRLNTSIPAEPIAQQKDLGFLACDLAGFPNGRRPYDDVVDIELTVVEGAIAENALNLQTCDVSGATPVVKNAGAVVNDGALPDPAAYLTVFPYLNTPTPGSVAATP
ncbi:DUF4331 domain-containing protein [Solimonas terrae]|nr:DUF4331 domain-containing protein [Solimonas terrae]